MTQASSTSRGSRKSVILPNRPSMISHATATLATSETRSVTNRHPYCNFSRLAIIKISCSLPLYPAAASFPPALSGYFPARGTWIFTPNPVYPIFVILTYYGVAFNRSCRILPVSPGRNFPAQTKKLPLPPVTRQEGEQKPFL